MGQHEASLSMSGQASLANTCEKQSAVEGHSDSCKIFFSQGIDCCSQNHWENAAEMSSLCRPSEYVLNLCPESQRATSLVKLVAVAFDFATQNRCILVYQTR